MYNKRVFTNETMNKMDGLFHFLESRAIPYCVSFGKWVNPEVPESKKEFKATVTWFGKVK